MRVLSIGILTAALVLMAFTLKSTPQAPALEQGRQAMNHSTPSASDADGMTKRQAP